MNGYRVLSFAVASYKLGYVFLVDGKLVDWRMSRLASLQPRAARHLVARQIRQLRPDVLVTEDVSAARRKGERARAIVATIAEVATAGEVLTVAIPRPRSHANKYVEAAALVERFPELMPWMPKPRRLWDKEPPETMLFEAVALALVVIEGDRERMKAKG